MGTAEKDKAGLLRAKRTCSALRAKCRDIFFRFLLFVAKSPSFALRPTPLCWRAVVQAYAPTTERKYRRVRKRYALVCLEAYAPRLESGTAINAAIMLPRLATCVQSPNLARNHDSEQPWKLYSSKLKPIRNASSTVVR